VIQLLLAAPAVELSAASEVSTLSGPRIAFWVTAAIVVLGALSTVWQRNLVAAVMSLVATFFGLAATYAMLSAHFLAALQVLVYAGAIMVLFIFVVMVLNRDESDRWAWRGLFSKSLGAVALVYTVVRVSEYLTALVPPRPEAPPATFGTVAGVGELLFTDYLFAFEAVSLLLLIAVIGAVVVARAHRAPGPAAAPESQGEGHA
jgi:NADH-quinone oxidoreductase subunit J